MYYLFNNVRTVQEIPPKKFPQNGSLFSRKTAGGSPGYFWVLQLIFDDLQQKVERNLWEFYKCLMELPK